MSREPEEPFLFDLPLSAPPPLVPTTAQSSAVGGSSRSEGSTRRGSRRGARPESLPLFGDETPESRSVLATPQPVVVPPADETTRRPVPVPRPLPRAAPHQAVAAAAVAADRGVAPAPLLRRMRAAFGDLAILLAVGAVAAAGATLIGAELGLHSLPALLVFLLSFSFLYCVVSLAFWGQTPGMAWSGLIARTEETEPLSFGQTAMRWLGHWLTWALLGLPGLLALTGRSLADRLSRSSTYETPISDSSAA
jgi:uncharacterized RDD family membrane protein YckC